MVCLQLQLNTFMGSFSVIVCSSTTTCNTIAHIPHLNREYWGLATIAPSDTATKVTGFKPIEDRTEIGRQVLRERGKSCVDTSLGCTNANAGIMRASRAKVAL